MAILERKTVRLTKKKRLKIEIWAQISIFRLFWDQTERDDRERPMAL